MGRGERGHEPSQRQLRVGERIRHLLAEALIRGEVHDLRLDGVSVTIGEVRMSPDLRLATVFAAELGAELRPATQAALQHAAGWLAGRLARQMNLRYAPKLRFVADPSYGEADRLERLLERERRAMADRHREDGDGPA